MFNFLPLGMVGIAGISIYALWRYFIRRPKNDTEPHYEGSADKEFFHDEQACKEADGEKVIDPLDLLDVTVERAKPEPSDSTNAVITYLEEDGKLVPKIVPISDIVSSNTTEDSERTSYTPSDSLLEDGFDYGNNIADNSSSSSDSFSGGDGGSFGGAGASDNIDSTSSDTSYTDTSFSDSSSYSDSSSSYDSSSSSDWSSSFDSSSWSSDTSSSGFDSNTGTDWF